MKMEVFLKALREDDFGIGDSFRLGNFEFEVVGTRGRNRVDEDPIFREAEFDGGRRGGSGTDDPLGELERAALYRLVWRRDGRSTAVVDGTAGERSPRSPGWDRRATRTGCVGGRKGGDLAAQGTAAKILSFR